MIYPKPYSIYLRGSIAPVPKLSDNSYLASVGSFACSDSEPQMELPNEEYIRWTPHPVIVTIRDNRDYIKVFLYSYYTTITGWGVLLRIWGFYRGYGKKNRKLLLRV